MDEHEANAFADEKVFSEREVRIAVGFITADLEELRDSHPDAVWRSLRRGLAAARVYLAASEVARE